MGKDRYSCGGRFLRRGRGRGHVYRRPVKDLLAGRALKRGHKLRSSHLPSTLAMTVTLGLLRGAVLGMMGSFVLLLLHLGL